jgi:hypothetical protein
MDFDETEGIGQRVRGEPVICVARLAAGDHGDESESVDSAAGHRQGRRFQAPACG